MSFKRDGDDTLLLNNLKRRRVSELLAMHIPDDEALLLKNGRYTCVVCRHRPIFDTLDILAIHRKGKKHLENLSVFLTKQQEVSDIVFKRRQDQYLKTGSSHLTLPHLVPAVRCLNLPKGSPLLKEVPYNSCCRRKAQVTDRKLTISLEPKEVVHNVSEVSPLPLPTQKTTNAMVRSYLKSMQHKGSFEKAVEKSRNLCYLPTENTSSERLAVRGQIPVQCSGSAAAVPSSPSVTEEQRRKADFFLNLRRDGWKRTLDGQWVKDDEAEFDSDEETPPLFQE